MSSNPLMMGYGGGDLLRTGAVWPAVGSLPRHVCAGCGLRARDESALEVAPPAYGVHDDALYKSTAFTFFTNASLIQNQCLQCVTTPPLTHVEIPRRRDRAAPLK